MAETKGSDAAQTPEAPKEDNRVDESTLLMLQDMGIGKPSENFVRFYQRVKILKDKVQPGRLSPEGVAIVASLAEMVNRTLELVEE